VFCCVTSSSASFRHPRGFFVACSDLVRRDLQLAGADPSTHPGPSITASIRAISRPCRRPRNPAQRQALGVPSDGVLFLQVGA